MYILLHLSGKEHEIWIFRRPFIVGELNENDCIMMIEKFLCKFFSSPEPKAQVSFSDQNLSVVVDIVVNFSHFCLLLQNHWTNFNQTWHNASLGEGDSSLFKWRAQPFSKGRWLRNIKNTLTKSKNPLLPNGWANFN